jgi:hypothetical protein
MSRTMVANNETAILERIIEPTEGDLPPEAATFMLRLDFSESDHRRMTELSRKASDGSLSPEEQEELDGYIHVSDLLAFVQSKARTSHKRRGLSV